MNINVDELIISDKGLFSNDKVRIALRAIFSNPVAHSWYARQTDIAATSVDAAIDNFLQRSAKEDITPTIFFDPVWFRANYRVEGANAFLSYLNRQDQRFAWPSPLFAPRWYARRYYPGKSIAHPFLNFLSSGGRKDPHPLLNQTFLAAQSEAWVSDFVALEFLTDSSKYRLKPHPLFDSAWYLAKNADVAQVGVNPLEHYLQHGHREGRNPNRIFNVAWYRNSLAEIAKKKRLQIEPLTHYVVIGFLSRRAMGPGLIVLARPTAPLTAHGPAKLIDALSNNHNIYAGTVLPSKFSAMEFKTYYSEPLQEYNPDLPERILIIRKQHLGLMYSPRCASARLVFWWLKQMGLLEFALRFSNWPHDFETVYHNSREYITAALSFEPNKNSIYKIVRHPISRILSTFRHCLQIPDGYGVLAERAELSFDEFLNVVQTRNYLENIHCLPQVTALENTGKIKPIILKIEDGVDTQLRKLEVKHGLPPHHIDSNFEVKEVMQQHIGRPRHIISVGPNTRIAFGRSPDYRLLVTDDIRRKIYGLYRADFDAYGYSPDDAL